MIARMTDPIVRRRIMAVLIPVLLVLLFISIVAFLREFRPEAAGFEQKGPLLLLYHVSRLGLAFYITILCYSAGYRALELFQVSPRGLFNSARQTFILCFFFGASLYGIAFTVLGLAGLISLESGLASTIPVLLFSYSPLRGLLKEFLEAEARQPFFDTHASPFFTGAVILVAVGAALLFLLTRVVFIAVYDPNIWEHYLHYYRAVLASGSTQPNEVWHHFYASKGAGLIFLANVLSDFFGAQLVSACFVVVAGVIILDLLLEYCRSTSWAFLGVMLFFTFLSGDVSDGAMFKHHLVLLGYVSFALWGSVWLQQATAGQSRPLMVAFVVSLVYLGFYLPVTAVIFPAAFLLVALASVMLHVKARLYWFLTLACVVFAGAALDFVTNWVLTGLIELTPIRWFWVIADRVKVERVFGTGGIEFFLAMNNDLSPQYDWSFSRAWKILRYPVPRDSVGVAAVLLTLLGVLVLLVQQRTRETVSNWVKCLAYLAAFILPLSAFAQAVQTVAVDRMALYSIVFTTLAGVVIWKTLVDTCVVSRLWHAATLVIVVCGMAAAFVQATRSTNGQRSIIYQYAKGGISLKDSFEAIESRLHESTTGISISAMSEFRRTIRPDERILRLAYDAGFSYALPGEGIVSEPTYSLIRNPRKMLTEKSNEVADYLRDRKIGYFTLNLQSRLFSTIAFTSLFDVREMPRYFSVVDEDGDFFILTWRRSGQEKPLPDYLLTVFELKRTGVLHFPFTDRFAMLVTNGDQLVDSVAGFEKARDEFRKDLDKAFGAEVLPLVSLDSSKALLCRILDAGKDAVDGALVRRMLDAGGGHVGIRGSVSERKLKARFVRLFRDAIYREYEVEVGSELASLFRRCDERVPFARNYPADATCD